jgi:F-box-like
MSLSVNKNSADETVTERWEAPLFRCPDEIIVDIIRFLDKRMLPPVALTCKTLNRIVSPLLYESFPVLDAENGVRYHKDLYVTVQTYIKTLSRPNATFVRHLILDAITEPLDRTICDRIASCVNLCRLTLYVVGSWEKRHVEKYTHAPFLSVKDLTLRILSPANCRQSDYYDSNDDERWYLDYITSIGQWMSHLLQMFNSLDVLRILIDGNCDRRFPRAEIFSCFPKGTRFSSIKELEMNRYPYYPGKCRLIHKLFPSLKSITFTAKGAIKGGKYHITDKPYGLPSGMQFDYTPSPYRGHFVAPSILFRIMRAEQKYSWKVNIDATHLFVLEYDIAGQSTEDKRAQSRIVTAPFHDWATSHQLKVIPICRANEFAAFGSPDSEVYLWTECFGRLAPKYEEADIQNFISNIVPTTRSLIVDTHIRLHRMKCDCQHSYQSKYLHDLFKEVVKREPHFLLQRLQNFPTFENWQIFRLLDTMDIRCMRPLGTLRSLTSIDLDFLYASICIVFPFLIIRQG